MVGRLVITSVKTCFRHQRLEQRPSPPTPHTPLPQGWQIQEEEAGPQAAATGVCRRGILRSISAYFPQVFEPWVSDESYGMPLGERGDQKYEDLSLSPLFKSNCWESGGLSKVHSPVEKAQCHSWRWGREKTHPRRDSNSCHYLRSQLNPTYVFFSWYWRSWATITTPLLP